MGRVRTHRETCPEQYDHPLVGKSVTLDGKDLGTVERVFKSKFGEIACTSESGSSVAYPVSRLKWPCSTIVVSPPGSTNPEVAYFDPDLHCHACCEPYTDDNPKVVRIDLSNVVISPNDESTCIDCDRQKYHA